MTQRLKALVEQYLTKNGAAGKAVLAAAVGKHPATVDRWIRKGPPSAHDAFKIALACGVEEQEALRIAREEVSEVATESA